MRKTTAGSRPFRAIADIGSHSGLFSHRGAGQGGPQPRPFSLAPNFIGEQPKTIEK